MSEPVTCPTCGLPFLDASYRGPWVPNCNPIRSPDCWRTVAVLPKHDSPERAIIAKAAEQGRPQG